MKKFIAVILLAALLCSTAFATIGVPAHIAYKGNARISRMIDAANVRDANGNIIGTIMGGSKVYVDQKDWTRLSNLGGEFATIIYNGRKAYVYCKNFAAWDKYRK